MCEFAGPQLRLLGEVSYSSLLVLSISLLHEPHHLVRVLFEIRCELSMELVWELHRYPFLLPRVLPGWELHYPVPRWTARLVLKQHR